MNARTIAQIAWLVLKRPKLWITAVATVFRVAPNGWWRQRPFLPLPAPEYQRFRVATMYGGDGRQQPVPTDFIDYLEWCRDFPKAGWFRRIK